MREKEKKRAEIRDGGELQSRIQNLTEPVSLI